MKLHPTLKLILIFTIGALALGFAVNYALMGLSILLDLDLKHVEHSTTAEYLNSIHSRGFVLLFFWPLLGFVCDFYTDKK